MSDMGVRPEAEVVAEMASLADALPAMGDADARAALDRTLSLMLELRVPREPDDPAELARTLDAAMEGPTYTTHEVMERLERHGRDFRAFLERFRSTGPTGLRSAATSLLPSGDPAAPRWHVPVRVTISIPDEGETCRIRRVDGGGEVEGVGGDGRGVLAAILRAHVAWRDAWA